jgi:3-dehydroquinate dehydratase type I
MICVSIAESTLDECRAALKGLELAEIRIDKTGLSLVEIKELFSAPLKMIATCRPGTRPDDDRMAALLAAIAAGAAYVDFEIASPPQFRDRILAAAREKNCRIIISYHNHTETPLKQVLLLTIEECFDLGADIAKVVCRVQSVQDCARLFSLYETRKNVVALGLGKLGLITRIAGPFFGAPLTYACLAPGKETAEGQPDIASLRAVLKLIEHDS